MDYKPIEKTNGFFRKLGIVNERMITRDVKEYTKAFESEDRISLKNDLKKLGYNYKLSSYAKEIYNDFLKIQRKCENIKKVEELQRYVDHVIKMKKVILNKLNSGQYSIEDKNLITYINKWLEIQKQKGVNVPNTNLKDNIPKYTGAKIKDRDASDLTSYYVPKNSEKFDTIVDSELISEENEKNVKKIQDEIIDEKRKKLESDLVKYKSEAKESLEKYKQYVSSLYNQINEKWKYKKSVIDEIKLKCDKKIDEVLIVLRNLKKDVEDEYEKKKSNSENESNISNNEINPELLNLDFNIVNNDDNNSAKSFNMDENDLEKSLDFDENDFHAEEHQNSENSSNSNSRKGSRRSSISVSFIESPVEGLSEFIERLENARNSDTLSGFNLPLDYKKILVYLIDLENTNMNDDKKGLYKKELKDLEEYCKTGKFSKPFLECVAKINDISDILHEGYKIELDSSPFSKAVEELKIVNKLIFPDQYDTKQLKAYLDIEVDGKCEKIKEFLNNNFRYKKQNKDNEEIMHIYDEWSKTANGGDPYDYMRKLRFPFWDYKECASKLENNYAGEKELEETMKLFDGLKKMCNGASSLSDIEKIKTNFGTIKNIILNDKFFSDEKYKGIKSKFQIDLDSELAEKRYTGDKEETKYQDLSYKVRKIISQWIPSLSKIIELKVESQNKLEQIKSENCKLFLKYLKKLDNYHAQNQNESKDGRYNKLGFNTVKNVNGKEFTIEKKMWNVKRQGKTSSITQSYVKPYFSVKDVQQGDIGDCWLESTLKSMVLKSPDKLLEVFPNYLKEVSNIDGSLLGNQITVRLYDYDYNNYNYTPKNYKDILVDATELTTNKNKSAWNAGKVLWAHIIEKAMDKFIEKFKHNETNNYGEQIKGGNGAYASVMLTGKPTKINKVSIFNTEVLEQLRNALKDSDAPTCGTKKDFGIKNGYKLEKEQRLDDPKAKEVRFLFSNHGYTLKHIHDEDKSDISKTKIDLINPWGKEKSDEPKIENRTRYYNIDQYNYYENAVGKNEITISLDEFIKYFEYIYC